MSDFLDLEDGTGILALEDIDFLLLQTGEVLNALATRDVPTHQNMCMRSGERALPGELVQDEYTGSWVLPQYRDHQPYERKYRSRQVGKGPLFQDDTNDENFITTDVTVDDL